MEERVIEENKVLEAQLEIIMKELAENKKELKYKYGVALCHHLHPFTKIPQIPGKLKEEEELHRQLMEQKKSLDDFNGNIWEYQKYLKEQIKEHEFYNKKDTWDTVYAIGEVIDEAKTSFKGFILLPFRLAKLYIRDRLVRTELKKVVVKDRQVVVKEVVKTKIKTVPAKATPIPPIEGLGESILFIATNGAGLGHLTRCLAIARRIKKTKPETEIIFLTTSLALTIIQREGFTAYCIPSLMLIKNMSNTQWNILLKNMLTELFQLYRFSAAIFDGATPYASISGVMASENQIPRIWVKRGSEKSSEIAEKRNEAEKHFDYIVVPGEAGNKVEDTDEKHHNVNPIIYLDKNEIWSREDVRRYLKIPEGKKAVYIQLGAGNINDINSDINRIITELRKHEDVVMILGESMIGNELKIIEDDIIIIKDYPNAKYFNGFDFAISACGYNSFHELVYFGLPTIFLPNMNTKTDDQYGRAMISQNHGAGIVVTSITDDQIKEAIDKMCDESLNAQMRENAKNIIEYNGADEAAKYIIDMI